MKYRDLIHFDPIVSNIQLVEAADPEKAKHLVRTFVFSGRLKEDIKTAVIGNLILGSKNETKGIQIVGNYGTGKSHLMSLVSAIAENSEILDDLQDQQMREAFKPIAGKFNVLRFEIGTDLPLKDIVFYKIEKYLESLSVSFSFQKDKPVSWKEQILEMLSVYEEKFPDRGLLVVIDETLEYLTGRQPIELNNDLMLLRQLGETCNGTRFRIMFGVQEMIYRTASLQYAAEMLNKVEDRYMDLIITRNDVAYVVQERLLKKTEQQKKEIMNHLLQFTHLFADMNVRINEYTNLFPVHPRYIENFENIRHGKSQREILTTLSRRFSEMLDKEIASDMPGLITYDEYWKEIAGNPSLLTIPDIRTVKDAMEIIEEQITTSFTKAKAAKRPTALRIAHALAIRVLFDDLDKHIGATADSLVDDLCPMMAGVDNRDLLVQACDAVARDIVTATSGQYVSHEETGETFFIRTEGGINIDQIIKDYAENIIRREPDIADQYFFDFLQYLLQLSHNTYRAGFKIWEHSLTWNDHKSFRLGYIFFGNPNERSTTEPIQHYYLFFLPLFGTQERSDEADEVYFSFSGLSQKMKETVQLFGAAKAKLLAASSGQKQLFQNKVNEYLNIAKTIFDKEYPEATTVWHKGKGSLLSSFSLPGTGNTKEQIFTDVASRILNPVFNEKYPDYPSFPAMPRPISKENLSVVVKSGIQKIIRPGNPNRDGEGVLSGLGLWSGTAVTLQTSKYAMNLLSEIKKKGDSGVLNRDDLVSCHYIKQNLWYSKYGFLQGELYFLVLCACAFTGEIEVLFPGNRTISAANIEEVAKIGVDDFCSFTLVRRHTGIPLKELKLLFSNLGLPDLTSVLEQVETAAKIVSEARNRSDRVVRARNILAGGISCRNIPLVEAQEAVKWNTRLEGLSAVLDRIQGLTSYGKLKNFSLSIKELEEAFSAYPLCEKIETLAYRSERFSFLVSYLNQALNYIDNTREDLSDEIKEALDRLATVLTKGGDTEIGRYETQLRSLIDRYATYYLELYYASRLSPADAIKAEKLLVSEEKRICDILKDAPLLVAGDYKTWLSDLASLQPADHNVNKALLCREPFQGFNPREFAGRPRLSVIILRERLAEILEKWTNAIGTLFSDPVVKIVYDVLKPEEREFIERFKSGGDSLHAGNAKQARDIVIALSKGIDKVEISYDHMKDRFSRPMQVAEAAEAFNRYLEELCAGREHSKVRIVFK